jgi:hypothetical protein
VEVGESFGETVDESFYVEQVHRGKEHRSDKRLFCFFSCKTFHNINHESMLCWREVKKKLSCKALKEGFHNLETYFGDFMKLKQIGFMSQFEFLPTHGPALNSPSNWSFC